MGINRKSLTDLRTLSGRVDQASVPYRAYLKISCLEMEKARLGKEKDAALRRVATIDRRVHEIEVEKMALVAATEGQGKRPGARPASVEPAPASRKSTGGFKVRY